MSRRFHSNRKIRGSGLVFSRRSQAPQNKKVDTILGKDSNSNGRIEIGGSIRVDGYFDGEIKAAGDVTVGDSARVKASIRAVNITIAGEVVGNLYASGRLEIASTGRLCGEVKTGALCIEDGAIFKGSCEMIDDRELPKLPPGKVSDTAISGDEIGRNE